VFGKSGTDTEEFSYRIGRVASALGVSREKLRSWIVKNVPDKRLIWDGKGRRLPLSLIQDLFGEIVLKRVLRRIKKDETVWEEQKKEKK